MIKRCVVKRRRTLVPVNETRRVTENALASPLDTRPNWSGLDGRRRESQFNRFSWKGGNHAHTPINSHTGTGRAGRKKEGERKYTTKTSTGVSCRRKSWIFDRVGQTIRPDERASEEGERERRQKRAYPSERKVYRKDIREVARQEQRLASLPPLGVPGVSAESFSASALSRQRCLWPAATTLNSRGRDSGRGGRTARQAPPPDNVNAASRVGEATPRRGISLRPSSPTVTAAQLPRCSRRRGARERSLVWRWDEWWG